MIKTLAVTLLLLGDLNFTGLQFLDSFSRNGYDPAFPFADTAAIIQKADIALANLEGPLSLADWSEDALHKEWRFRQLPVFAKGIKQAGIDILLLGNNHIGDAGEQGIADTLRVLEENQLAWVPPPQDGPLVLHRQGLAIEIWNADVFSPTGSTPWAVSEDTLVSLVEKWYLSPGNWALSLAVIHTHPEGPDFSQDKEELAGRLRKAGLQWIVFGGDHQSSHLSNYLSGGVHLGLGDFVFGCDCSGATKGKALSLTLAADRSRAEEWSVSLGTPGNGFVSRFDIP